jgi:lactadherin
LLHRTTFPQEFGANSDSDTERYHYLSSPFIARYVRFHPTKWNQNIAMRAGLVGCPHTGMRDDHAFFVLLDNN